MEILEWTANLSKEDLQTAFKIVLALLLSLTAIVTRFVVNDYLAHRKQIHSIKQWLARSFGYDANEQ